MILVAGLSPAWQQIVELDAFEPGTVNRARRVHWLASGKVLNVATALANLGAECEVVTVVGGAPKAAIEQHCDALGIRRQLIETNSPTRTCTTIVDRQRGEATELVENAGPVTPAELSQFAAAFKVAAARASLMLLTGSLPQDTPATIIRDLMSVCPCPVLLDIRGPELLYALPRKPLLVKPNREELSTTFGRDLSSEEQTCSAMTELQAQGAAWVVVTQGSLPIYVAGRDAENLREVAGLSRYDPAPIQTVNPIGSGDCLLAGIAWGILRGMPVPDAICLGVAAATENALQLLPASIEPNKVSARAGEIKFQQLY